MQYFGMTFNIYSITEMAYWNHSRGIGKNNCVYYYGYGIKILYPFCCRFFHLVVIIIFAMKLYLMKRIDIYKKIPLLLFNTKSGVKYFGWFHNAPKIAKMA